VAPKRKRQRPAATLYYKRRIIISAEGAKTEPTYFKSLNNLQSIAYIYCISGKDKADPLNVLNRMKRYLERNPLKGQDMAWVVVDKDDRTEDMFVPLSIWANENAHYGFALSNPAFEFWLLLHYEEGKGINSKSHCLERLRKFLPHYNKILSPNQFDKEGVCKAIRRAKELSLYETGDWSRRIGTTTVYKLLINIFNNKTV